MTPSRFPIGYDVDRHRTDAAQRLLYGARRCASRDLVGADLGGATGLPEKSDSDSGVKSDGAATEAP